MAMDWSFQNLKGKAMGLLTDPEQQMGMLQNPMFNAGMGLLSSNYDPSINPWQAIMGGIGGAQQNKQQQEDRARIQELRDQLAALLAQQQQSMMPSGTMPGVDNPATLQPSGGMGSAGSGGYVDQVLRENMWRDVIGNGGAYG